MVKIKSKTGQMKIQQMAFMLVAVFLFFMLVALFFLKIQLSSIKGNAEELEKEQAISSIKVIANMPEFNCGSRQNLCLDKDKLKIMSTEFKESYENFWPIASIKVYTIDSNELKKCPGVDCNYFEVYESGQTNSKEFSTFVSVCEKLKENGYIYDKCEIGKLSVGMKINEA